MSEPRRISALTDDLLRMRAGQKRLAFRKTRPHDSVIVLPFEFIVDEPGGQGERKRKMVAVPPWHQCKIANEKKKKKKKKKITLVQISLIIFSTTGSRIARVLEGLECRRKAGWCLLFSWLPL